VKLAALLDKESIILPLKASNRFEAIKKLLEGVDRAYDYVDATELLDVLESREREMPTILGNGFFFPHARIETLDDFVVVFGISPDGIPDEKAEDEPIKFSFLIVCPFEKNSLMLKTRAAFLNLLLNEHNFKALLRAKNSIAVLKIIEKSNIDVRQELLVTDLMKTEIVKITPVTPLVHIVEIMFKEGIDTLPIVDEDQNFLGIVSGYNILRVAIPDYVDNLESISFLESSEPLYALFKNRNEILAKDIMSKTVVQVSAETMAIEAAFLMVRNRVRTVYIIENAKLLGILTRRDLISRILVE